MKKLFLTLATALTAFALVACGSSDDDPVLAVTTDTNLGVNTTVATSVKDVPFVFGAVPDLGTTGTTTLVFTSTATAPSFSLASGGSSATGTAAFGSCIFAVTSSSFPAGHRLAQGQTVTVNPCNMRVSTAGAVANGVATTRSVALLLGAAASAGASVTVGVNAGGQLSLNGNIVTTVTLTPVSG